ncbi:MAG: hypothetical protein SWY16_02550 [Cyanobacteriota bacterium]|nr:hypothetical protein [Cyanobacteriota bacterium]
MNSEQTFRLIDRIIPFEVCLYHQVIPLSLEGSRLYIGMVDPEDHTALSYLRQLLGYLNCSLVPQEIDSQMHQTWLSAYLNHTNQAKQDRTKPNAARADSPTSGTPPSDQTPKTQIAAASPPLPQPLPSQKTPHRELPHLKIDPQHLTSPPEVLAILSPPQLLQELLGRVLTGGIGRLYFERQANFGRVLWSQDGILQSVLENLPLPVFQGTINELKRLMGLPLIPVKHAKQVEIERRYHQDQLLLRFRVKRGDCGEEGTLQVLRGAALKFYQQQKIADLSRDALMSAQQLQKRLHEIRQYHDNHSHLSGQPLEVLPAIEQVLQLITKEMETLQRQTP